MSGEGQELTDETLLERVAARDRHAFDVLVARHQASLFRFVRGLCRSEADAEDSLQETFVTLWRRGTRDDAAPIEHARGYLFQVARHAAFRRGRRRAAEPATFEGERTLAQLGAEAGWGQAEVNPERYAQYRESADALARALARLREDEREVLVLRDVEGLSGDETAEALGLSRAAMKSRLHRARLRLMAELREVAP